MERASGVGSRTRRRAGMRSCRPPDAGNKHFARSSARSHHSFAMKGSSPVVAPSRQPRAWAPVQPGPVARPTCRACGVEVEGGRVRHATGSSRPNPHFRRVSLTHPPPNPGECGIFTNALRTELTGGSGSPVLRRASDQHVRFARVARQRTGNGAAVSRPMPALATPGALARADPHGGTCYPLRHSTGGTRAAHRRRRQRMARFGLKHADPELDRDVLVLGDQHHGEGGCPRFRPRP
jgi:hypothetical protein